MNDEASLLDQLEAAEIDGLVPFLDQEEISLLLAHLEPIRKEADYGKYQIAFDLEQLQVADYPALFSGTPNLSVVLDLIQNSGMYDQHELDFLTLRSLVTLFWPEPESKEHLVYMAKSEFALHQAMGRMAKYIRDRHVDRAARLPYWARLAHLHFLRGLPEQLQREFGPDGIPCIILRSRDINAHTFPVPTGQAVVLDYALEPFLRDMNRFLHSYFWSREYAGPRRIPRAFADLLPRVLFFKGLASAYVLPPTSILFGDSSVQSVKTVTEDQVRFLIGHEIGHIALSHPSARTAWPALTGTDPPCEVEFLEHEHMYEFEADGFAVDVIRSSVLNSFRYHLHPNRAQDPAKAPASIEAMTQNLFDYGRFFMSVETLFLIMGFVEAFYDDLSERDETLPEALPYPSHPVPSARWERLKRRLVYDIPLDAELNRYSRDLLNGVLDYMKTLSGNTISELTKEALSDEGTNWNSG